MKWGVDNYGSVRDPGQTTSPNDHEPLSPIQDILMGLTVATTELFQSLTPLWCELHLSV